MSLALFGTPSRAPILRARTAALVSADPTYAPLFDGPAGLAEYVNALSVPGAWGDQVSLSALCDITGTIITVISSAEHNWHLVHHPRAAVTQVEIIFLSYLEGLHYNALAPNAVPTTVHGTDTPAPGGPGDATARVTPCAREGRAGGVSSPMRTAERGHMAGGERAREEDIPASTEMGLPADSGTAAAIERACSVACTHTTDASSGGAGPRRPRARGAGTPLDHRGLTATASHDSSVGAGCGEGGDRVDKSAC